jgi:outer membrane protease
MRNITALTVLVIITFSSFAINPVYSDEQEDERKYNFSIGLQSGFVYGKAVEIVYPLPEQTKNELYSELLWDMKPVFYFGLQLDFNRTVLMEDPVFFSSLSFKGGIPANSGNMEDRDWRSNNNSELTDFSAHTNKTLAFLWLDAAIGASLPIKSLLYIKPFISFSWMYFSFSGRDGKKEIPVEYVYSGEVIRYKQQWLLVGGGFSVGTKILNPFTFEISFQISPFTNCTAIDEHLKLGEAYDEYRDFSSYGLFLEPACAISYSVGRYEFSLVFSYRHIGRTSGNSHKKNINDEDFKLIENKAGAGLSTFDTRLLFKIHL